MNTLSHNVFGYGSLLWNPGFEYTQVRKVWLPDWSRRLWQGSTDHRGTPDFPGLVCTLVPNPGHGCWGLAYEVNDQDWPRIRAELDYREKDGYQLQRVNTLQNEQWLACWTYVADSSNPSYIGERPLPELAWRIRNAVGPSGHSADYLRRLHGTLLELQIEDSHVSELIRAVEDQ
ncbi:gamma-glutamylcyclotransferase [bacterium]|nr:gamma-glutamylcyclotransferase [bacterium]